MRRIYFCIALMGLAAGVLADNAPPPLPGTEAAWPQQDMRALRELQSKAYGSPKTDSAAPSGEAVMALGELGANAVSHTDSSFVAEDYDALFSLLERYRDELLKMGMKASDLDAQIKALRQRADELKDRLDALHPRDGLKLHGRLYSFYDDMVITGTAPLVPGLGLPYIPAKAAGSGLDFGLGGAHAEITTEFTRGPLSADARFDVVQPWGVTSASIGARRVDLEIRLPITLQAGDVFASLSPLTLWRNDDDEPFEAEPFSSQHDRLEKDMDLRPNQWRLTGGRASTEMVLFGKQTVELEDIASIAGAASDFASSSPGNTIYTLADGYSLSEQYSTYMDAWRVGLPLFDLLTLSDQGVIFWDVTGSQPAQPAADVTPANPDLATMRAFNETVQSGRAQIQYGVFKADLEYAMSSYTAPTYITNPAAAGALTGTALTYSLGVQGSAGHLRIFGRTVSSGFHASGAQGRTQDAGYEFFGPFPTENSQIGANGQIGLNSGSPADVIPVSYATRYNDVLIPPGVQVTNPAGAGIAPGSTWQNLLAYNYLENIDPYGEATPNRQGYGVDGEWRALGGFLVPKASYELISEIDPVEDVSGDAPSAMISPFTMSRLRAGTVLDFRNLNRWPIRLNVGYTLQNASNGEVDSLGYKYGLSSTQLDGGLVYYLSDKAGLDFGYRHLDVNGFNETFFIGYVDGLTWDDFGYGAYWNISDDMRLDLLYTQLYEQAPKTAGTALEVDEGLIRVTVAF